MHMRKALLMYNYITKGKSVSFSMRPIQLYSKTYICIHWYSDDANTYICIF